MNHCQWELKIKMDHYSCLKKYLFFVDKVFLSLTAQDGKVGMAPGWGMVWIGSGRFARLEISSSSICISQRGME